MYLAKPALLFGHDVTYKIIDRGLIEQVGTKIKIIVVARKIAKA